MGLELRRNGELPPCGGVRLRRKPAQVAPLAVSVAILRGGGPFLRIEVVSLRDRIGDLSALYRLEIRVEVAELDPVVVPVLVLPVQIELPRLRVVHVRGEHEDESHDDEQDRDPQVPPELGHHRGYGGYIGDPRLLMHHTLTGLEIEYEPLVGEDHHALRLHGAGERDHRSGEQTDTVDGRAGVPADDLLARGEGCLDHSFHDPMQSSPRFWISSTRAPISLDILMNSGSGTM